MRWSSPTRPRGVALRGADLTDVDEPGAGGRVEGEGREALRLDDVAGGGRENVQRQYDGVGLAHGHHYPVTAELPRQGGREAAARRAAAGTGQPTARSALQDGAWTWIEPLVAKRASPARDRG